jgi:hypothetical protein
VKGFQFLVARYPFQVLIPVYSSLTEAPFIPVLCQLTAQEGLEGSQPHHGHLIIKAYLAEKREFKG